MTMTTMKKANEIRKKYGDPNRKTQMKQIAIWWSG